RIGHPRQVADIGWVLPLAQRIPGTAAGEPAWVFALLRIAALEPIAGLDLGGDGIANILHRDGTLVVRSRDNARWVGASLRDSELVRDHMPLAPAGNYDLVSVLDGSKRIAAYRVLPDYPLVVTVGLAQREVLAGWTRFAVTATVLGGLLALLWLALLWVLVRSRGRQRQLVDSLRRGAEQLRETRRIAGIGDWAWELDTGLVTWSEEVYRIHGLPPQTGPFLIEDIPQRIHPLDIERRKREIADLVAGREFAESNYRIIRSDGAVRTIFARGEWADRTPGRRVLRGIQQDITELAETREQLHVAQEEYRFLFEHIPLSMFMFDRESLDIIAVNDRMLGSYGYTRDELLAKSLLDIRPAKDVAAARASAQLETAQRPQGLVWTHLRKDGSQLRVAVHTHDIDFNGRAARLVLALDVTEQERNEQRFQLIARATTDAVYDLNLDTGHLWWSDSFYGVFGYTRQQVPPTLQAWEELLHPDDVGRVNASLSAAIDDSGTTEWESEYRFRLSSGAYAEVVDRGFLLRDDTGRASRMVGGMLDLTQKHRDQSDLRLLRRALEATESGVAIADARLPDQPLVYVNAAFERITGYPADEVLGRNCRFLQGDERDQLGRHEIHRGIATGREARALLRNYCKDGTLFWNDLHVNPVRDEAGVITHFVGALYDVTERQHYQERIAHLATHDELTGLPNRTLLLDRLQQAIASASRFGRGVGVAFIDLDNFKLINDSLGHGAGDLTLRAVAARLTDCVRDADTVARFGGDEFVLLISEQSDGSGIERVIERVEAAFAEPLDMGGSEHYVTCSIGYCGYPQHGADAETLLMRADIAMYEAKTAGRNRVVEYRSEFDAIVSDRLFLVSRLREALAHDEFVLHFQPLFRADGAPTGLEALVRWQHPDQGLLPPGRFIGACESSGLIVPLGRWVLGEAC
ncbi:MAG: diguanylate cyclase, partial [Luteimonas sp.]